MKTFKRKIDKDRTIEEFQLALFLACDSDMTKYQQIVVYAKTIVKKYHIAQEIEILKSKMNKETK